MLNKEEIISKITQYFERTDDAALDVALKKAGYGYYDARDAHCFLSAQDAREQCLEPSRRSKVCTVF